MDLGFQLNTNQRLEQTLSPQLRQFVTILQKNSLELDTAIKDEIESNPLLELDDDYNTRDSESENSSSDKQNDSSLDDSVVGDSNLLDGSNETNYEQYLKDGTIDEDAPFKDLNATPNDSDDEWDRPIKDFGKSLQDNLYDQLRMWSGTRKLLEQLAACNCNETHFRSLVEYLINSLDETGFLQASDSKSCAQKSDDVFINEIETLLRGELDLEKATLPVREALHVLQSFNPRGIGARNQRECFLIQAYALPNFPQLGISILEKCYDDLLALRYAKIAKVLGVSTEEVQSAIASFAKLSPHPGFLISNSNIQTVSADLKIVERHGHIDIESVHSTMQKRLRINQTYKNILNDKNASKADRDYVKSHLNKAVEFIKAVDNRYSTIELVMRAIFKRQQDFFTKGPAFLKPMVQQDIATDISRDVSTVNRSINGKYVDTPYGIYELKKFFTSGVKQGANSDSKELSSATILLAIKKLVDEENCKKPLSDQAIADKLKEQGIKVARRTVAKYRERDLRILPANQRKK